MIDEHTKVSMLNIVDRSITAERLADELEPVFANAGGPPIAQRMDNGPKLISQALQRFCDGKVGLSYIHPVHRGKTATSNRSTTDYARSASTATTGTPLLEARVVVGEFKDEHTHRHRQSALGYEHRPSTLPCRCTPTPMACSIN